MMTLKYILLALIDLEPMTGYDLTKVIEYSVLVYWNAKHTQIYKALKELENDEYIKGEFIQQVQNPSKRKYSISEKGRLALRQWLLAEPILMEQKHPYLIQFSFSHNMNLEDITDKLKQYKALLEIKRQAVRSSDKRKTLLFARDGMEEKLWQLSIEHVTMHFENEILWVEKALAELGKGEISN